jgi:nitrogen regulatory protein P-II 1
MKEIKAYLHRHRVADVIHVLERAGFRNLCVLDVKGLMPAMNAQEQDYSLELGGRMITEARLELFCDDTQVEQVVTLTRMHALSGQSESGRVYVSDVSAAYIIQGNEETKK